MHVCLVLKRNISLSFQKKKERKKERDLACVYTSIRNNLVKRNDSFCIFFLVRIYIREREVNSALLLYQKPIKISAISQYYI